MKIWKSHGTKILGYLSTVVPAIIIIDGLIPPDKVKYALAVNVLLAAAVVKRGHTNTKQK